MGRRKREGNHSLQKKEDYRIWSKMKKKDTQTQTPTK
jgi:hypothetical protein